MDEVYFTITPVFKDNLVNAFCALKLKFSINKYIYRYSSSNYQYLFMKLHDTIANHSSLTKNMI